MVQNLGKLCYGSGRFVSLRCGRMKGRDGGRRRSAKKGEVGGRGEKNAFPFPLPLLPPLPLPLSPLYACYTEICLKKYSIFPLLLEVTIDVYQVMAACYSTESTKSLPNLASGMICKWKAIRCLEGPVAKTKDFCNIPAGVGIACRNGWKSVHHVMY